MKKETRKYRYRRSIHWKSTASSSVHRDRVTLSKVSSHFIRSPCKNKSRTYQKSFDRSKKIRHFIIRASSRWFILICAGKGRGGVKTEDEKKKKNYVATKNGQRGCAFIFLVQRVRFHSKKEKEKMIKYVGDLKKTVTS